LFERSQEIDFQGCIGKVCQSY